jgi:hypothetical protein
VRVTIEDVDTHFCYILEDLLGAVEAGRSAANNRETIILIRLNHVLGFDSLLKLWVVVLSCNKAKATR